MTDIRIRRATTADGKAVVRFYEEVIDSFEPGQPGPKWTKGVYPTSEELAEAIEQDTLYIALEGESLVAAMVFNDRADDVYFTHPFASKIAQEDTMVVHLLAVGAGHRGKGLASRMMRFAEETARMCGAKAIRLDVMEGNTPAFALYESLGFVSAGVATLFYEDTGWADFTMYELVL